jgi:phosphoglucosamine mutase
MATAAKMMTKYPQVLVNVRGDKSRAMAAPELAAAVTVAEDELSDTGRVLLRPSGTEPAIRVMVEAADEGQAERVAAELADAVRAAMG